ncbi:VOC family protein [Wenyingzhuangia sp. IMCC45467]
MRITPYLSFNGQCQQAANFYTSIFGGEIILKNTYKDAKIDIPENYYDKIQHLEIKSKKFHLMMFDATPDTPHTNGNNIHLAVDVDSKEELKVVFDKLSKKGTVHTPLQETSWNAIYGRCTDQYNIHWMVNFKK